MREILNASIKAFLIILALFFGLFGLVSWFSIGKPDAMQWALRLGMPATSILIVVYLVWDNFRPSKITDHVRQRFGKAYFTKNGLNFSIEPSVENDVCFLNVWFQN